MVLQFLAFMILLTVSSAGKGQSRWSRQISSYTSDISDWVPLTSPVERELPQIRRQAVAEPRILSDPFPSFVKPTGFGQDTFPSRGFYNAPANRQLYLQSVPSAPQNFLTEQGFGQGLRFGLAQPNFPLGQGFVAPQYNFDNIPQLKPRPQIPSNPVKFENPPPISNPSIGSPVKPFLNQVVKNNIENPKFVDGYRVENSSDYIATKKPQSLQKIKFENADKSRDISGSPKTKVEREEVQLLYVPLESLNRGHFNFRSPLTSPQVLNTELYNQKSNPLMENLAAQFQTPLVQPMDTFNSREFLSNFNSGMQGFDYNTKISTLTPSTSTTVPTTTAKPKKLKPHQPPLAIFITNDEKKDNQLKVGDVLHTLKNANTVAVLDSVNSLNAPKVFIGPSTLSPPANYVKFELPYLSNIEDIDRKLRQLPFFVAPLSYHTPQGFAKIPFPSPHVGSVVINSFIKDTPSVNRPTVADVHSNSYSRPTVYKQEQIPVTQKPSINYYTSSSPKLNTQNFEKNSYSIEPQSVSTLRPLTATEYNRPATQSVPYKSGSYFISNFGNQHDSSHFAQISPQDTNYKFAQSTKTENDFKIETTSTPRTTVTTTTKLPSTFPNQLLETHNPYSINQAFHFSTPLDYHNFFDEYKESYKNSDLNISPTPPAVSNIGSTPDTTPKDIKLERPKVTTDTVQSTLNYQQSYAPEMHYQSELQHSRFTVPNTRDYFTKPAAITQNDEINSESPVVPNDSLTTITKSPLQEYSSNAQTHFTLSENNTEELNIPETSADDNHQTKTSSEYNQYDGLYNSQEISSTSSTTTSTRRPTTRSRGRPRYPTIKPESHEYSTRATVTRKPFRERKPLPSRSKYEPNKITADTTNKPLDNNESTTKSPRTRTRGRVHYKLTDQEDSYIKRHKPKNKEHDLAYQRDVLHQNYPVTLMERTSTTDIEAITEPSEKTISTNNVDNAKVEDTEDAYSNDKLSITEPVNEELKDLPQEYTSLTKSVTETSYVAKLRNYGENYDFDGKGTTAPQITFISDDEVKEDHYSTQTSPEQKTENQDFKDLNLEVGTSVPVTYSSEDKLQDDKLSDVTSIPETGLSETIANKELRQEQENIVETTPSYNRVRVRPGVIRQYHQASSTESSRSERRKPLKAITYRPAFERRRTTMRIEEIEADLKTKQVHIRPEFQDYKQPVYKPESSNEPIISSSTTEQSTKRGQLRRRRPSLVTTTEGSITRRPYDAKNRFRGRRPTEKPTEKSENPTNLSSTTVRNNIVSRYNHRTRLSERYNKKPEPVEEQVEPEDQDSNYSINRPKYVAPETDRWSPKISTDSFKPYNPNNIADENKVDSASNNQTNEEQLDIITARNEYEDILISVTPAYNNRVNKKIPDIPPTLEAYVEQTKVTKSDSTDTMSTFESMLEEVMKSLEEQDENEYTNNVMKHKGGEIGEIPPEKIISSGENYSLKSTTSLQEETTTITPDTLSVNTTEEMPNRKNRRRGFWKKVKVRPLAEGIDVAESQYYPHVVNRLGQYISKNLQTDMGKDNSKTSVTTYKPNYQFLKDFFEPDDVALDEIQNVDISKMPTSNENSVNNQKEKSVFTTKNEIITATEKNNPGDMDLGTGSPDPTINDGAYYSEPTEPVSNGVPDIDRSDGFSLMDYLFGVTPPNATESSENLRINKEVKATTDRLQDNIIEIKTESIDYKTDTTDNSYVPEEITTETSGDNVESVTEMVKESHKIDNTVRKLTDQPVIKVESTSISSYMDPTNVVSTSMSTEVSHETEICFRGKCIKSNKNLL